MSTNNHGELVLCTTRDLAAHWLNEGDISLHAQGILFGRMSVAEYWMADQGDPLVMRGYINEINFFMRRDKERKREHARERGWEIKGAEETNERF